MSIGDRRKDVLAWIAVSALAFPALPTAAQSTPTGFCADLEKLIAAAAETPPFASLTATTTLGPSNRCGAIRDDKPRFFCVVESRFSEPVDVDGLAANVRQCLGARLSGDQAVGSDGTRFQVGNSGVALVVSVQGCPLCRAGSRLSLFVHAPEAAR